LRDFKCYTLLWWAIVQQPNKNFGTNFESSELTLECHEEKSKTPTPLLEVHQKVVPKICDKKKEENYYSY